jgi:solute carrier family 25 citrate transporter 1
LQGKLTRTSTLLAGVGAGTMESIIAVTPSEVVKTRIVKDASTAGTNKVPVAGQKAKGGSTWTAVKMVWNEEGVRGFWKGTGSVVSLLPPPHAHPGLVLI